MAEHENPVAATPEEASAVLRQLAGAFLGIGGESASRSIAKPDRAERPALAVLDAEGRIKALDVEGERLVGRASSEVSGLAAASLFGSLPAIGASAVGSVRGLDGGQRSLWLSRSQIDLGQGSTVLVLQDRDLTIAGQSELRYRHLVEQIPAVVFTAALDGGLYDLYVSPQIESMLGYTQEEWLADPVLWYDRLHPDDRPKLDEEFARGCMTGGPFRADCRFLTRNDVVVWVHGEARLIRDSGGHPLLLQGVAFDISDTKRAEEIVRASLSEKETLLKEIHHRVKNNLQVTSSLLKLQADRIPDEAAQKALRDAQGRIRSMALVHELLYRSQDLSNVDLGRYVRDLTDLLLRSYGVASTRVQVKLNVVPAPLPIDIAVPCGLVLNELVSNALKHAFPDGKRGTVLVEIHPGNGFVDLTVRDDGIGMSADVDFRTTSTLGLRLIRTLADQIEGELAIERGHGTAVRLRVPQRKEATR